MNTKTPMLRADMLALVNEAEHPAQARHIAGQAVMRRPKLAHLMALAADCDERGLDALINSAAFHRRFPKE